MLLINNVPALTLLLALTQLARSHVSYNSATQLCCNGTVITKPGSKTLSCCGSTAVDPTTSRCCAHGQVLQVPPGDAADSYGCCYNGTTGSSSIFHYRKQLCCSGKVLDKPDPEARYGCCNGSLYERKDSLGCCAEQQFYNMDTHICCSRRNFDLDNVLGVLEYRVSMKASNTSACCSLEQYDFRSAVCCSDSEIVQKPEDIGKQRMNCCGDRPISNITTQFCIREKLYEREDFNYYVCGDQLFDTRKQLCCGDRLLDKRSTMACCFGSGVFNTTTHKCCFDTVQLLTKEDLEAKHDACCAVRV